MGSPEVFPPPHPFGNNNRPLEPGNNLPEAGNTSAGAGYDLPRPANNPLEPGNSPSRTDYDLPRPANNPPMFFVGTGDNPPVFTVESGVNPPVFTPTYTSEITEIEEIEEEVVEPKELEKEKQGDVKLETEKGEAGQSLKKTVIVSVIIGTFVTAAFAIVKKIRDNSHAAS